MATHLCGYLAKSGLLVGMILLLAVCRQKAAPEITGESETLEPKPPFACNLESLELPKQPQWIVSGSTLRMRQRPAASATVVASIPFRSKVTELKRTGHLERIDGRIAPWVFVRWQGRSGWVFGGYLSLWHSKDSTALARLAEGAYKQDRKLAAELYRQIVANDLDKNRDMMTSCRLLAEERLLSLNCQSTPRKRTSASTPDQLFQEFKAQFEHGHTERLLPFATCGFMLALCNSDVSFASELDHAMSKINKFAGPISPPLIQKMNPDGLSLRYDFKIQNRTEDFAVFFAKGAQGWEWYSFCTSADALLK